MVFGSNYNLSGFGRSIIDLEAMILFKLQTASLFELADLAAALIADRCATREAILNKVETLGGELTRHKMDVVLRQHAQDGSAPPRWFRMPDDSFQLIGGYDA